MNVNNKNIGIAGYWFATNYGGVASYYSLYRKIESLGYAPFLVETPYLESDKEGLDTFPRKFFRDMDVRISKCFQNSELDKLNELADTFILGSDQVLTSSSIRAFGKLFLMEFAQQGKNKIAVSASCGGDNLDMDSGIVEYAKKMLRKFDAVSVREYSAVDIVRNKFGVYADLLIDPIFFMSKNEYAKISNNVSILPDEPYMLSYILDPSLDKKKAIFHLASQNKLKVKVALDGRKFTYNKNYELMEMPDDTLPELDFYEWLAYLNNASFIFTDSFHGAAMAIILNKPFIMYANYQRGYPRFLTLAKMFQLKECLIEKADDITEQVVNSNINFEHINQIIAKQNKKAEQWLIQSLTNRKGIAEIEKPYYSIETYKSKAQEKFNICSKLKCTGCSACANVCPAQCINMVPDNEGFIYPVIDKNKCINCTLCEKICPVLNREQNNDKKPQSVHAGYSLDEEVRYMSTSGGAFTEFAKYVLKMSGVCYGAAYDNVHNVSHVRITSEKQLPIIRQSKYLQSNINDTYKNVKNDLEHGMYVMFCGTPCQCAGLSAYLRKEYKKLVIVDFICHSICSPKAYQYYLHDIEKENDAEISRVWFKNKESTWKNFSVRIDFKDKEEYYRRTCKIDDYIQGFWKYRVCARPSCHACQFKGTDRVSDITLADYWGLKWNNPNLGEEQMKNGVSLIIINSEKGQYIFDMFSKNQMYTEEHTLEEAVKGNGGYYNSQRPGLYRDYFFKHLETVPFHSLIEMLNKKEEELLREREKGTNNG